MSLYMVLLRLKMGNLERPVGISPARWRAMINSAKLYRDDVMVGSE